jgi:hypothetical protein
LPVRNISDFFTAPHAWATLCRRYGWVRLRFCAPGYLPREVSSLRHKYECWPSARFGKPRLEGVSRHPLPGGSERERDELSGLLLLQVSGDLLDFAPHAKEVTAPELADLLFGVAAPHQLQRDVERLGRAVPAIDTASAVEV